MARWHMVGSLGVLACLVVLAACSPEVPTSSVATEAPTASGSAPSLTPPPGGASPTPAPSPTVPAGPSLQGELQCGAELVMPADILLRPPTAELAAGAAAAALRDFAASESGVQLGLPRSGWRLAIETDDQVTYLARGPDGWVVATLAIGPAGWEFYEGGACDLAVRPPEGAAFATWQLDPAQPPEATSTSVAVLATEIACASGKPPFGRLLPPVVLATDDAITIALLVRTAPGSQDCPGNPAVPVTVELGAPLGLRHLFDGSTVPPSRRD